MISLCRGLAKALSNSFTVTFVQFGQGSGFLFTNTLHVLLVRGILNSAILPQPSCIIDSVAVLNSLLAIARADLLPCLKDRQETTGPWVIKTLSLTVCLVGWLMAFSQTALVTSLRDGKRRSNSFKTMQVTMRRVIVAVYWSVIHDNSRENITAFLVIVLCFREWLWGSVLEQFSTECRKTKTKCITLANHKGHRQSTNKILRASNYLFCFTWNWLRYWRSTCLKTIR